MLDPAWDWDVHDESKLRFYDRKTSRYLCDISLIEAEWDAAVAELEQAQERIRQLEAQLQTHNATPNEADHGPTTLKRRRTCPND